MDFIVHLTTWEAWEAAQLQGAAYYAPSLETEGFIHCSRPAQILAVANTFYRGLQGTALLWIAPKKVTAKIRWEVPAPPAAHANAPAGGLFPHIYGPLNLAAVVDVVDFPAEADGEFRTVPTPRSQ